MKRLCVFLLAAGLICGMAFAGGNTDRNAAQGGITTVGVISVFQTEKPEGPAEIELTQKFMAANPDVKIDFTGVPMNDLWAKLTALATADDLPDAYFMGNEFKAKAQELGIIENIRNILSPADLDQFIPASLEDASLGNVLAYLPFFATPPAVIYRLDWFQEKNLNPPVNWDDFRNAGKALTVDTNGDARPDRYGFAMLAMRNGSAAARFLYMMRTFGIRELYQNADKSWATDIGTPQFRKMLKMFTDFALVDKITPPGVIEMGYPEAAQTFASGLTAMMITGPNAVGTIYNQNPDLRGKIGSVVLPQDTVHASTLVQNGYAVNPKSTKKDAIARWMKFVTSDENCIYFNGISGRIPVKKSLQSSPELNTPAMKGFVDALQYCYILPDHPGIAEVQDAIGEAYQNTIANGMSIDQASDMARQRALAVINKYK